MVTTGPSKNPLMSDFLLKLMTTLAVTAAVGVFLANLLQ